MDWNPWHLLVGAAGYYATPILATLLAAAAIALAVLLRRGL